MATTKTTKKEVVAKATPAKKSTATKKTTTSTRKTSTAPAEKKTAVKKPTTNRRTTKKTTEDNSCKSCRYRVVLEKTVEGQEVKEPSCCFHWPMSETEDKASTCTLYARWTGKPRE